MEWIKIASRFFLYAGPWAGISWVKLTQDYQHYENQNFYYKEEQKYIDLCCEIGNIKRKQKELERKVDTSLIKKL
jgi:hypothetical protein